MNKEVNELAEKYAKKFYPISGSKLHEGSMVYEAFIVGHAAGYEEGLEEAIGVCARQGQHYEDQLEGMGGGEFEKLDFAVGTCLHLRKVLRALKESKNEN